MIKKFRKIIICLISGVSLMLSGCSLKGNKYNVSLDKDSITMSMSDEPVQLTATVTKNDAPISDYTIKWSSDAPAYATVDEEGYVHAVTVGVAKIFAQVIISPLNIITKSCQVTVVESPKRFYIDPDAVTLDLNSDTKTKTLKAIMDGNPITNVKYRSSNASVASVVSSTGKITAKSIGSTLITATYSLDTSITATCNVSVVDSSEISITLDKESVGVIQGNTVQLNVKVEFAKNDSSVNWSGSANGVSVNSTGLVSVSSTAVVGTQVTITATSNEDPTKSASCVVKVKSTTAETYDYTIMYYMCASNLENEESSGGGGYYWNAPTRARSTVDPALFSADIMEILSVDLPDTVKLIIETGGTTKWGLSSSYIDGATSISESKLQRWEVVNHKLKLISTLSTNYMAKEESFESFLSWGLEDYAADQMGVVISGHGGGIAGCAYDDNYTYTYGGYEYQHCLDTEEVATAAKNALNQAGRDKFTWIGYDCCLMQCADVASINADYFEYMVASQESELGEGWDHDTYLKLIKSNTLITPEELLPVIASSFVAEEHSEYCSTKDKCLQTLSVLDLSKMPALISAFNNYVSQIGTSSSTYSSCKTAFKKAYNKFGEGDYGLADFVDFMNKLSAQFTSVDIDPVVDAIENLVIANSYCSRYSMTPCGINAFFPEATELQVGEDDYTGSLKTKFTGWQTMCLANGDWIF